MRRVEISGKSKLTTATHTRKVLEKKKLPNFGTMSVAVTTILAVRFWPFYGLRNAQYNGGAAKGKHEEAGAVQGVKRQRRHAEGAAAAVAAARPKVAGAGTEAQAAAAALTQSIFGFFFE